MKIVKKRSCRIITTFWMILMSMGLFAQKIQRLEYFLNTEPGVGQGNQVSFSGPLDSLNIEFSFRTDTLPLGGHFLYVRVMDTIGVWSAWEYQAFHVYEPDTTTLNDTIHQIEYFFGKEPGPGNGIALNFSKSDYVSIEFGHATDSMDIGAHMLFVRSKKLDGLWSPWVDGVVHVYEPDTLVPYQFSGFYSSVDSAMLANGASQQAFNPFKDTLNEIIFQPSDTSLAYGEHLLHGWLSQSNGLITTVTFDTFVVIDCPMLDEADFLFEGKTCVGDSVLLIQHITQWGRWPADSFEFNWTVNDSLYPNRDSLFYFNQTDSLKIHFEFFRTADRRCQGQIEKIIELGRDQFDSSIRVICNGDSALIHGQFEQAAKTYYFHGFSIKGCDSTSAITLIVNPVYDDTLQFEICHGDIIDIHGEPRSTAGIYVLYDTTTLGCDSTVTVELVVRRVYAQEDTFERCFGDTLRIHGQQYFEDDLFTDTLQTIFGCDSIFQTRLILHPVFDITRQTGLCAGDSLLFDGLYRTQSGIYSATYQSIHGCDSTVTVQLSIDSFIRTEDYVSICLGDSLLIGGLFRSTEGDYEDYFIAAKGCDSIVTRHLSFIPRDTFYRADTLCFGASYPFFEQSLTQAGVYEKILKNAIGCDSSVFLFLVFREEDVTTLSQTICFGDSLFVGNGFKKGSGLFSDTLINRFGCDSIVRYLQTERVLSDTLLERSICRGDSIFTGNRFKFISGSFSDTLINQWGCDSLVATQLEIREPSFTNLRDTICFQDVVNFFGRNLNKPGIYTHRLVNAVGCDSVVELNLSRRAQFIPRVVSAGFDTLSADSIYSSYAWFRNRERIAGENGRYIVAREKGTYDVQVTNVFGCSANSWDDLLYSSEPTLNPQIFVYPNPASTDLHFISSVQGQVLLYQSEGKLLQQFSVLPGQEDIDVSRFASGTYLLVFKSGPITRYLKFIIVR